MLLFQEHAEPELVAGRGAELLTLLASAEFEREVMRVPALESVVWRALSITCLESPEASLAVLRSHPGSAHTSDSNLTLLEETLPVAEAYRAARAELVIPAGLRRLLELGNLEAIDGEAARMVSSELAPNPEATLAALDALHRKAPSVIRRVLQTVDRWLPPDDRLYHELSGPERAWLTATLKEVDGVLSKSIVGWLGWMFLLALGGLVWLTLSAFGLWWGLLACLPGFVGLSMGLIYADRLVYRRKVRLQLVTRVAARGVSPDRVVEWCSNTKKDADNLGRFQREIENDVPLYAFASLSPVSEKLRARGPRVPAPERVGDRTTKRAVLGMVPQREAAKLTCEQHAERPVQAFCASCSRAACSQCAPADVDLHSAYCVDCQPARELDLRKALSDTEDKFRGLGSFLLWIGALLTMALASVLRERDLELGLLFLGVILFFAAMGLPLRLLWRHARHVIIVFAVAIIWVIPVGTIAGINIFRFVYSPRAKRVFSPEFRALMTRTPPIKRSWLFRLFDLGSLLALLWALWMYVR